VKSCDMISAAHTEGYQIHVCCLYHAEGHKIQVCCSHHACSLLLIHKLQHSPICLAVRLKTAVNIARGCVVVLTVPVKKQSSLPCQTALQSCGYVGQQRSPYARKAAETK